MKPLFPFVAVMLTLGLAPSANSAGRHEPLVLAQVCTEIYQPVCGTDANGKRVTYSNACFARLAKATDVTPGECSK